MSEQPVTPHPLVKKSMAVRQQVLTRLLEGQLVYERDMKILSHELKLMLRLKQVEAAGRIVTLMGGIELHRGNYPATYDHFMSALQYYQEDGEQTRVIGALSNVGEVNRKWGKHDEAIDYFQQARNLAEESEDWMRVALTLNNLGMTYLAQDNPQKALEHFVESIENGAKVREGSNQECETYNGLAQAHLQLQQPSEAWQAAQKALTLSEQYNLTHDIAAAHRTMGLVAAQHPQTYTDPAGHFEQSRAMYSACHAQADLARTLVAEGQWRRDTNQVETASVRFTEAIAIFNAMELLDEAIQTQQMLDAMEASAPNA